MTWSKLSVGSAALVARLRDSGVHPGAPQVGRRRHYTTWAWLTDAARGH